MAKNNIIVRDVNRIIKPAWAVPKPKKCHRKPGHAKYPLWLMVIVFFFR